MGRSKWESLKTAATEPVTDTGGFYPMYPEKDQAAMRTASGSKRRTRKKKKPQTQYA